MTYPQSEGRKFVRNSGIDRRVIGHVGSKCIGSEYERKPIAIGDKLNLRAHDRSCPEVNVAVLESGIAGFDDVGPKIMLAHEEGVERRQPNVLIRADVASQKEGGGGVRLIREPIHV